MGNKQSASYIPESIDIISIGLKYKIVKEKDFEHNYDHYWILYIYCNQKYQSKKLINYVMNNLIVNKISIKDSSIQYYEPIKSVRKIKQKGTCKIYCFDELPYEKGDDVVIELIIKNMNDNTEYPLTL